jgi:hypothetical protein
MEMRQESSSYRFLFWTLFWLFSFILSFAAGVSVAILFLPSKLVIQNYNAYDSIMPPTVEENLQEKPDNLEKRIQRLRKK